MMGQRAGQQQRGTDPLDDAGADEHARTGSEPAAQRGGTEDRQSAQHDSFVAVEIPDGAAGQQHGGQRDRVPVDDPLQAADLRPQAGADLRHGDIDDRYVQQHEKVTGTHHHQHDPPRRAALRVPGLVGAGLAVRISVWTHNPESDPGKVRSAPKCSRPTLWPWPLLQPRLGTPMSPGSRRSSVIGHGC